MAWIEFHQALERHPKVLQLCEKTGWDRHEALGKLACLWFWVIDYAEDGDLRKHQPFVYLNQFTTPGKANELFKVLKECGFITQEGLVNSWLDYAGRYLKGKYHQSNPNKLKAIWKLHKVALRTPKGSLKGNLKEANLPTIPTLTNPPTNNQFEKVWSKYPKPTGKKAAERHFKASVKTTQDFIDINKALENYLKSADVLRGFVFKGATFFNNWRDYINYTDKLCPEGKCNGSGTYYSKGEGGSYKQICTCPAGKRVRQP